MGPMKAALLATGIAIVSLAGGPLRESFAGVPSGASIAPGAEALAQGSLTEKVRGGFRGGRGFGGRGFGGRGFAGRGFGGRGWGGRGWAGRGWAGRGWAGRGWAGRGWGWRGGYGWRGYGWGGYGYGGYGWAGPGWCYYHPYAWRCRAYYSNY